jgi:hypothetical protein
MIKSRNIVCSQTFLIVFNKLSIDFPLSLLRIINIIRALCSGAFFLDIVKYY